MMGRSGTTELELLSGCRLCVVFAVDETVDATGAGFVWVVAADCAVPRFRRKIAAAPNMKRLVTTTHTKTILGLGEGLPSVAVRVITCPSNEPHNPRFQERADGSLADCWCSCVDGTPSLLEFAIATDTRGFGSETFRFVASNRDSEGVAAMAARCTDFSIDSTSFPTVGWGAGEAAAAFAKIEVASFGKVLLKKFSGAVDATAGGLKEVADGVRVRAWVDAGLGASGPGFGGFSGIADWIRSGKFNVPCGM
jgi:hypothetical protein